MWIVKCQLNRTGWRYIASWYKKMVVRVVAGRWFCTTPGDYMYVDWVFSSYLTAWVFPGIIFGGFPPTSKTKTSFLVFSLLGSWFSTVIKFTFVVVPGFKMWINLGGMVGLCVKHSPLTKVTRLDSRSGPYMWVEFSAVPQGFSRPSGFPPSGKIKHFWSWLCSVMWLAAKGALACLLLEHSVAMSFPIQL